VLYFGATRRNKDGCMYASWIMTKAGTATGWTGGFKWLYLRTLWRYTNAVIIIIITINAILLLLPCLWRIKDYHS